MADNQDQATDIVAPEAPDVEPEQAAVLDDVSSDDPGAPVGLSEIDEAALTAEELEELRASEVAFSWQASEYIHHHKGPGWYAGLAGVLAVLVVLAILLKFWLSIPAFIAMGVAVYVYAHKPPRTLLYELTPKGITVDSKFYPYSEFRSFGVQPDVEWHSIELEPTKRFYPRMTLLFEDDDFEDIVGHLELHLPTINRKPDVIDRLSRYLRF